MSTTTMQATGPAAPTRLLLVEDEPAMARALQLALERRGFDVAHCGDGSSALQRLRHDPPAAVLLDLGLPGMDGLQVLHRARAEGVRVPVLVLTARDGIGDRVVGLNAGADDYLSKPFDLDELEARVRALLRRSGMADGPEPLSFGPLHFDPASGALYLADQPLEATPRERALLKALLARPGHAVAKEKLFRLVYPMEVDIRFEAIEVVAYRLRKKLAGSGVGLVTLRGLGYLLKADRPAG